jgi:primosomal protein N' (replication factor Y)
LHSGLSENLIAAIHKRLELKEQSLIFVNRRGYAPVLFCSSCGWSAACQRCSANLVIHLK